MEGFSLNGVNAVNSENWRSSPHDALPDADGSESNGEGLLYTGFQDPAKLRVLPHLPEHYFVQAPSVKSNWNKIIDLYQVFDDVHNELVARCQFHTLLLQ